MTTIVKLVKSLTTPNKTHLYEFRVHSPDGWIRTRMMTVSESDQYYGKLRMTKDRYATRSKSFGPFTVIDENHYNELVANWQQARPINNEPA
jgi:hypothetical protein